ncbi:hypothetical protein TNIN_474831, partial [Trichonephila inaurata madagascariensis]
SFPMETLLIHSACEWFRFLGRKGKTFPLGIQMRFLELSLRPDTPDEREGLGHLMNNGDMCGLVGGHD